MRVAKLFTYFVIPSEDTFNRNSVTEAIIYSNKKPKTLIQNESGLTTAHMHLEYKLWTAKVSTSEGQETHSDDSLNETQQNVTSQCKAIKYKYHIQPAQFNTEFPAFLSTGYSHYWGKLKKHQTTKGKVPESV